MTTAPEKKPILGLSRIELGIVAVLILVGTCLVCYIVTIRFNRGSSANTLSAERVKSVSAIDVVVDEGYTVTSAVCEVISNDTYQPSVNIDGGLIVFHAFRITKPSLGAEVVVLFASNHAAVQGRGLVFTVNPEAIRLFPDSPDATRLDYPINLETDGAQSAITCAQQAGSPR